MTVMTQLSPATYSDVWWRYWYLHHISNTHQLCPHPQMDHWL